jgi:predicted nucleic acid-binding Zn ribbon protein
MTWENACKNKDTWIKRERVLWILQLFRVMSELLICLLAKMGLEATKTTKMKTCNGRIPQGKLESDHENS